VYYRTFELKVSQGEKTMILRRCDHRSESPISYWKRINLVLMDIIAEGIMQKLIKIEEGGKYIVCLDQAKRCNFKNPEEKVQAESFLKLALVYKYPILKLRKQPIGHFCVSEYT
jgi:hypothetical protein